MPKTVESVFNDNLGSVLRRKHARWPDLIGVEQTNVLDGSPGLRPDIIVRHPGGLPVAVETEYTPARTVEQDARRRLGKILRETGDSIEQAIALCIPAKLANVNQSDLETEIEKTRLEFCVLSVNPEPENPEPIRWPESGWIEGGIDDLAACIELAALSEKRLIQGMRTLELGVHQAAGKLREECADAPDTLEAIASALHQRDGVQTSRMAMAIVANALTFHAAIAGTRNIPPLDQLRGVSGLVSKPEVLKAWRYILENVNYWPIFSIASEILLPIRNGTAHKILDRLAAVATELVSLGATSQHDFSGRILQRLISDRKFLATFYTLPSSSALLAGLAVARLEIDWSKEDEVTGLRIADFACGTGALLHAAYEETLARYRRTGGDDSAIHPAMIERALAGTDIMPAATHLTASVLSSAHPSVTFENTSIVTLPYGEQPGGSGRRIAIGALDLIEDERTLSLFGTGQMRLRGSGDSEEAHLDWTCPHGGFDLVIMNPPFTRPTNHQIAEVPVPSFAGFATTDDEQRHMSARLKNIRGPGMAGHGNAGLASNFIDLAHVKVTSPGGVLALVLPAAFLQGEAWSGARNLLAAHYREIAIVSIATVGTTECAFSADTGMAEVLVVATRKSDTEQAANTVLFVNLLRRPSSILEAVTIARAVERIPADLSADRIAVGSEETAGCYIRGALSDTGCAGLRELGVALSATGLAQGELRLPRRTDAIPLPLVKLCVLGDRGLLDRDINGTDISGLGLPRGPFTIAGILPGEVPTWPALWSHDNHLETRMIVLPDSAGRVRPECEARAGDAWQKTASRLHFNRDFRINSQSLAACVTPEPSIGGRAWPNFICHDLRWEAPLVLWANTTLGLISFWWIGSRQHQGRAILTISKLPALTVLDPQQFNAEQLDRANTIFEEFRDRKLLPANEAWHDETRQALDRAVLVEILDLPEEVLEPLDLLRRQWCAEPSVHGGKRTRPIN